MTSEEIKFVVFCFCFIIYAYIKVFGGRQYHKSEETIRNETANEFAQRLKEKAQKPEFPWEDWLVSEDDIDEVLKEMGVEQNGKN